jgi:uncharacterized protein (TIGR00730 family)
MPKKKTTPTGGKKKAKSKATKIKNIDSKHLCLPAKDLPIKPDFGELDLEGKDWRQSHHWRIFKIMSEFVDAFQFLADFKETVTIFGSARLGPTSKWYKEARKLGKLLAKEKYSVITGGGPGIMEAGNRGAYEGNGESIGINIKLPYEQRTNKYVKKSAAFHYFFARKVALAYSAQAYVYFPGGFGTMDELFELLTLVQTKKIATKVPLILVGRDFWEHLDNFIYDTLLDEYGTIDEEDRKLYHIVDTAEEAMKIIRKTKPRKEF